jgi:hypothetical protein
MLKSVPRFNGIPCLRRDRSALTRVLDKSEATCIRQVEPWKGKDTVLKLAAQAVMVAGSGRAATPRHSILGMRMPPNTYLSSSYCLEVEGVERFTRCSLFLFPPTSCFIMSSYPEVCPYFVRRIPGRSFQFTT